MELFLDNLKAFFNNYVLMTAIVAWLVAQILKIFTGVYRDRRVNLTVLLFSTGGMPSSHSATVLGLTTASALQEGFGSTTFAISAILSIIVIIDACGVRYETGKQSKMLNKIVKEMFTDTENAEKENKNSPSNNDARTLKDCFFNFI